MFTLTQLIEKVRERADQQTSNFITDSELTGYINSSYAELYDILVSRFEDYYCQVTPFSIASGNTCAVPSDMYKVRGIDMENGGDWTTVYPFNFIERNRVASRTRMALGKLGVNYRLMGNTIYFVPEDRAPGNYKIWYIPKYSPLSSGTDTLSNVLDFEEYIIVDAAIKCMVKEESDPTILLMMKAQLKQRIEAMASNRDAGSPERIGDVNAAGNKFGGMYPFWGW